MASKIFVNYRREDSIALAGRLHDRLAEACGRDCYVRNLKALAANSTPASP
jgi:hypothetical protein